MAYFNNKIAGAGAVAPSKPQVRWVPSRGRLSLISELFVQTHDVGFEIAGLQPEPVRNCFATLTHKATRSIGCRIAMSYAVSLMFHVHMLPQSFGDLSTRSILIARGACA